MQYIVKIKMNRCRMVKVKMNGGGVAGSIYIVSQYEICIAIYRE